MTTTFLPSGAPFTITPLSENATSFSMPTVDGANLDLTISADLHGSGAWLSFGQGVPCGPTVTGNVLIMPGQTLLLTSNPATLAATATNPAVSSPQNGAWQTAAFVSAIAMQRGSQITLQRGTASARTTF